MNKETAMGETNGTDPREHAGDRAGGGDGAGHLAADMREFAEEAAGNARKLAGDVAGRAREFLSGNVAENAEDLAGDVAERAKEFFSGDVGAKIKKLTDDAVEDLRDLGVKVTERLNGER
jgi:hypothetical protein